VSVWLVVIGARPHGSRATAADRAEPPFRFALRHGSHVGSLTLGKSCENPVGRLIAQAGTALASSDRDLSRFNGAGMGAALAPALGNPDFACRSCGSSVS
jgi:hypothetical protein